MALDTYTNLQTAFTAWLANSLFTANYADFITLFEATANRHLRVRQQETTATLTATAGSVALPSDYLSFRRLTLASSPKVELEYVEPSYLQSAYANDTISDVTRVFTIEGANLLVRPIDDSVSLTLLYYAKIPALATASPADGTQTNWLLTAHPDAYLFGSLVEAQAFGVNDERIPMWKSRRDEVFDEISTLSNRSRGVGGIRIMGYVP